MDEIEKRLREATDNTVKFYSAWRTQQKDGKAREELMEAVHELRKIAARLEIEIAVSERNEMSAKPIPIPPHRASRKRPGEGHEGGDDEGNDNGGNNQPNFNRQEGGQQSGGGDRPRGDRPQHGGGHQGGPRRRTLGGSQGGGGKGNDE
jgi:hypothetical protein